VTLISLAACQPTVVAAHLELFIAVTMVSVVPLWLVAIVAVMARAGLLAFNVAFLFILFARLLRDLRHLRGVVTVLQQLALGALRHVCVRAVFRHGHDPRGRGRHKHSRRTVARP
jgi:hypothetical protein